MGVFRRRCTRARDLFDIVKIIQSEAVPVSKRNILAAFFQKTLFKNIPEVGRVELLSEEKFSTVSQNWFSTLICPKNTVIVAVNAIKVFRDFINVLFSPETLDAVKELVVPHLNVQHFRPIPPHIREPIIEAGKRRQLIQMRYKNIERTVEPYSLRYRILGIDLLAVEYFYGFDRTRGNTIKSFFLHEIQGVSISPNKYMPRWTVEFS